MAERAAHLVDQVFPEVPVRFASELTKKGEGLTG
jgi:hypothetical protein